MSSASSTDRSRPDGDSGFQPWHFYMLLAMAGAIAAVVRSNQTHPAALLLISAAAIAAGLAATALHFALMGFFEKESLPKPVTARTREFLEQEKALILRSIKELEFDRAMRKVGDKDFAEIGGRLRARAVEIMQSLDKSSSVVRGPSSDVHGSKFDVRGASALRTTDAPRTTHHELTTDDGLRTTNDPRTTTHDARTTDHGPRTTDDSVCTSCQTTNDPDARFCKQCGAKL